MTGDYKITKIYAEITAELNQRPLFYYASVNNKALDLLIDIFRNEKTCSEENAEKPLTKQYRKLLKEIDDKYDEITFSDAADFMCLSKSYFSKLFKKLSDMTFSEYLNYVKVEKALELMKEERSLSITETAMKCGFDTIRNFNRVFKKITGFPPKKLPRNYAIFNTQLYTGTDKSFDPTLNTSELIR